MLTSLLGMAVSSLVAPPAVLAAAPVNPESKEELQVGESFAVQGDWDNAIAHFKAAIEKDKNNVTAHYDLGVAYTHVKELGKARESVQNAISIDPHFVLAYTQLGAILVKLHDLDGAETALKKAVEIDPNDLSAKDGLAALYRLRKEKNVPPPAPVKLKELRTATLDGIGIRDVEHHEELDSMIAAASRHHKRGELATAKKLFEAVLERDETLAMVHSNLGLILACEGNFRKALVHERQAIELDWSNAECYFNYGFVLAKMGEWKKASVAYAQAYKLDPARVDAKAAEAVARFKLGEIDDAEKSLQMLSSQFPNLICVRLALATIYQAKGKNELAKMQIMLALQTDQKHVEAHERLASLYLSSEKYPQAMEEFGWVLQNNPASIDAYVGLAACHSKSGNLKIAISVMRKAVGIAPKNADSIAILSSLLMKNGEDAEAKHSAELAIKLNSEQPLAHKVLSACTQAQR